MNTTLRFVNPAYALFDASVGVAKDAWNVQFFGQNLAGRNVSSLLLLRTFVVAQTPTGPARAGVQIGYKF